MSDIKPAHRIDSTVLADGTTIHINDHVYLAPEHLGEPYYIGRVMEFCTSFKRKGLQARIAWFNRPKDVINRKSADPCLLVATMHSDINPVSSIRGKCTVTHKYYVQQIDEYRKQQDNFYYNQLYDRYIQRVYDVVPCETVQNVPMEILEALKQRFQFIIVEQGKAADLTVARRTCCVCQQWCQSAVSVKCAGCQKSYHMSCLNPPLARKPSKGFAWQCAYCTRQEVLAESSSSNPQSPASCSLESSTTAIKHPSPDLDHPPTKAELKRQTRATRSQVSNKPTSSQPQPEQAKTEPKLKVHNKKVPKNQQITMTHMWPFRYFGVNTNISDILDVDDRIYPRAKSRIGARYQATVPDWNDDQNASLSPIASDSSARVTKKKNKERMKLNPNKRSADPSPSAEPMEGIIEEEPSEIPMIPARGGEDTVTRIYRPSVLDNAQIDDYMDSVKELANIPVGSYSSDLMDRALYELELSNYHTDQAFQNMEQLSGDDFKHLVHWSQKEIDAFEQSIREHGHDLNFAKKNVQTKSMADIVRFFYQWKKTDRYELVYSDWTKIYRPMKKFKKFPRSQVVEETENENEHIKDTDEDPDPTIVPKSTYKKAYQCMNCLTEESKIWRRSPSDFDRKRKVFNEVLCDDCGIYWLKYAKTKPIVVDKKNNNNNNTTLAVTNLTTTTAHTFDHDKKRKRSTDVVKSNSKKSRDHLRAPSPLHFEPTACKVCLSLSPSDRLYVCHGCGMSVHNDCYGIERNLEHAGWLCDPCDNKVHPVSSYVYECVLCFKSAKETQQPLKRTAGYHWAHVQCATFIPEIKFAQPNLLSPVEYIGCVDIARLNANCHLCDEKRGACVPCTECRKAVHVQCAIDHDFKLAFEMQPNTHNSNKSTKYPIIPAGLFGPSSPSGLMIPQVWCPSHNVTNRKLIELSTRTANDTQQSSLMTYVKNYKCIAKGTTPAMRRFRASRRNQKNDVHRKMLTPRAAALEALSMDDSMQTTPTITKVTLTSTVNNSTTSTTISNNNNSSSSNISRRGSANNLKKRVCSSVGCPVRHTPIWWNVGDNKKICQRCHQNKKY